METKELLASVEFWHEEAKRLMEENRKLTNDNIRMRVTLDFIEEQLRNSRG